ncbi:MULTISPECIES: DsbA family protein [Sphingomonas]|uniref:DsbA family protein n=1 Tax=Sphingomonas TaxID=13687 RepID=UPI000DEF2C81|nr:MULTISPECIES: thioredoxin domain-containing protein [Sphingomonas]
MLLMFLAAAAAPALMPVNDTPYGWQIGRRTAPKTLVEYGALNCPHCAAFNQEAGPKIMAAVKAGRVRFEYRPFQIFPNDPAATLIARCVPLSRRFQFVDAYYKSGREIVAKLQAADQSALDAAGQKGDAELNRLLVKVTDVKPLAARFGLIGAAVDRCVSDPKGIAWLERSLKAAQDAGVTGTPTFFLNGERIQFSSFDDVADKLK